MKNRNRKRQQLVPIQTQAASYESRISAVDNVAKFTTDELYRVPTKQFSYRKAGADFLPYSCGDVEFLDRLIGLYLNSPTLNAIIGQRVSLVVTELLRDGEPIDNSDFSHENKDGDTLIDVLTKCEIDSDATGNSCMQVSIVDGLFHFFHIPVANWRFEDVEGAERQKFVKVGDFVNHKYGKTNHYETLRIGRSEAMEQTWCIVDSRYSAGMRHYGLPNWISAEAEAETDYRIGRHNSARLKNGFAPSGVLDIYGIKTDEDGRRRASEIRKHLFSDENAGKVVINQHQAFGTTDATTRFTPIETSNEGEYLALINRSRESICISLGWDLSLLGIHQSGALGDGNRMVMVYDSIIKTYVVPRQNHIARLLRRALRNTDLEDFDLSFARPEPINAAAFVDQREYLTINEIRERNGLAAIPGGDVIKNISN